MALNLSEDDLAGRTLRIEFAKRKKKRGPFWSIRLFLGDGSKGVTIGFSSYEKKDVEKTIADLKAGKQLRGIGPRNQPLFQWLERHRPVQAKPKKVTQYRKHNLLQISLRLIAKFQKKMPKLYLLKAELYLLREAYNELQQDISLKLCSSEYRKLEKKLSAAIAYWETDWAARAVAATKENYQISLWEKEKNKQLSFWDNDLTLILKMNSTGKQMEYQGIAFSLEEISTVCEQVSTFKAEMAQKMAEERSKQLLAQIPSQLDTDIKALQQQTPPHWDKTSFLNERDLIFLEGYNHPRFTSTAMDVDIRTQAQMNHWIMKWIARVEKAFAILSRVNAFTQTILGLIASSPKYGVQTYALWLSNSKAAMLDNKKLDKKFRYALKDNTIASIADEIQALIGYGWLVEVTVGAYRLSVLVVTDYGKKILQLLEQGKVVATVDIHSHDYWLKEIRQKGHTAYVSFLNTPQSVANIANWTEEEVAAMQGILDEHMNGWQVLARWKLRNPSIKYKPLQRLLSA
jgi:hypothetical protein